MAADKEAMQSETIAAVQDALDRLEASPHVVGVIIVAVVQSEEGDEAANCAAWAGDPAVLLHCNALTAAAIMAAATEPDGAGSAVSALH